MGCCSDPEPSPEVKARAKTIAAQRAHGYDVTGAGRVPGSKYTITEAEINECTSKEALVKLVDRHLRKQRAGCCGRRTGVLAEWGFCNTLEGAQATLNDEKNRQKYFPAHVTVPDDRSLLLATFLGPTPGEGDPPNPSAYTDGDTDANMLAYNRKKLAVDVYSDERPPFKVDDAKLQKVEMVEPPTDAQIDGWSTKELRKELIRRGYVKAPYNIKVHRESGATAFVSIKKDSVAAPPQTSEAAPFSSGLPAVIFSFFSRLRMFLLAQIGSWCRQVRKMEGDQMRALLKLIGRDPRFQNGQPVVQPAYYERSCQNTYCVSA